MTATNEAADATIDAAPVDETVDARTAEAVLDADDVAEAAARDVARLLDRRGLREVVALAHRVLGESTWLAPNGGTRADDPDGIRCTLRQHERSTRRGTAGRAADDDRA
jgi:hypothetical protein